MIGLLFFLSGLILLGVGSVAKVSLTVLGFQVGLTFIGLALLVASVAGWMRTLIDTIGIIPYTVLVALVFLAVGVSLGSLGLWGQLIPHPVNNGTSWGIG